MQIQTHFQQDRQHRAGTALKLPTVTTRSKNPQGLNSVQSTYYICFATHLFLWTWHFKFLEYFWDVSSLCVEAIRTQLNRMHSSTHIAWSHFVQPFFTMWDLTTALLLLSHDVRWLVRDNFIQTEMGAKTHPMTFWFQPEGFVWFLLVQVLAGVGLFFFTVAGMRTLSWQYRNVFCYC